jgi:hypothetical protein
VLELSLGLGLGIRIDAFQDSHGTEEEQRPGVNVIHMITTIFGVFDQFSSKKMAIFGEKMAIFLHVLINVCHK